MGVVPNPTLGEMWPAVIGADDPTIVLVDDTFVADANAEFLADVTGNLEGTPEILTGVSYTDGLFDADTVIISGVADTTIIHGYVIYADTGNPATSRVLVAEDTNADSTPINFVSNGLAITVQFPNGLGTI